MSQKPQPKADSKQSKKVKPTPEQAKKPKTEPSDHKAKKAKIEPESKQSNAPAHVKKSKPAPEPRAESEDLEFNEQELAVITAFQEELNQIEDDEEKEIDQVAEKYDKLKEPIFERRDKACNKIPQFWFQLLTKTKLCQLFQEVDLEILKSLENLSVVKRDGSYQVNLNFKGNQNLISRVISKKFDFDEDSGSISGDVTPPVQWAKNFAQKHPTSFFVSWSKNSTAENVQDDFEVCKVLMAIYENPFAEHELDSDDDEDGFSQLLDDDEDEEEEEQE